MNNQLELALRAAAVAQFAIEGVRENWRPRPVAVEVLRNTFFDSAPFENAWPVLASAFQVHDISYRWKRGIAEELPRVA